MNPERLLTKQTETQPPSTRGNFGLGGIGLTMLYKLIDSGSIQRVKIGRRAFVTQASVDAFIASLTAA
jgi:hypothetical protein